MVVLNVFLSAGALLVWCQIVKSSIELNGTQTRTWKYLVVNTPTAVPSTPTFPTVSPLTVPIFTLPPDVTTAPNQNFPLGIIPPQALPFNPPQEVEVLPGGPLLPFPTSIPLPTDTTPVEDFLLPPQPTGPDDGTLPTLPPRPGILTISPDTAVFPSFTPTPAPSPLASTFPTFIPLPEMFVPSATSAALPLPTALHGLAPDLTTLAQSFPVVIPLPTTSVLTQCSCVVAGTCVTVRGSGGAVDVRIVTTNGGVACAAGQQYCCSTASSLPQTTSCGVQSVTAGVTPTAGQANFGEFPWSGIILNSANQYIGGAAIIDNNHLLTAAHLVAAYGNGAGLKIRLGDWDLTGTYEPVAYTEIAVLNIVTHPSYVPVTLQNDLAVITLVSPATFLAAPSPQVNSVCLPTATDVFAAGVGCHVAGWGKDAFAGSYQNIIKKVDVPIMGSIDCQNRLRLTKLGAAWNLDTTSFICAGGELGKDACQGDGGNALVCLRNGQYVVVGITAGGVECGLQGVPGLYVNVASYLAWIEQQIGVLAAPGNIDPRRG